MNGSKSTFKRKGYWLTALATAVLLAASSGTASAQITVTGPAGDTVAEGNAAVYTVEVEGYLQSIDQDTTAATITVTLSDPAADTSDSATEGEASDKSRADPDGDGPDISDTSATDLTATFSVSATEVDDNPVRFSKTATIRVQTNHDADAEDEDFTLSFTAMNVPTNLREGRSASTSTVFLAETGDDAAPDELTIADDEAQTYDLALDDRDLEAKEGEDFVVKVTAKPTHVDGSAVVAVQVDAPRTTASVDEGPQMVDSTDTSREFNINLGGNDKNRVEDTVTISAYTGTAGNAELVDTLSVTIEDAHELPAVALMMVDEDGEVLTTQPTSVTEGDSIMVVVMSVDKEGDAMEADEDLAVALMPTGTANAADYEVKRSITIDEEAEMSDPVEIEVKTDEDVGAEILMFAAVVSGDSGNGPGTRTTEGVLSLTIEDKTTTKITPKATDADYEKIKDAIAAGGGDEGLNPGETVTLMTSDLFEVMDGYTASYSVSVEGDAVSGSASGETITLDAKMAGEAKITVSGTARMPGAALIPTQSVSNDASLTFPVMVVDAKLVVMLTAEPMEIEEGGISTLTATANRAVTAGDGAVAIALAVVPSDGGTLDPASITIAMGAMSGSATLTANESVTVVASGSGVTGLMQVAVTVTAAPEPVPEPVPALPLIGQLLLGLGLLGGGARHLYRRRQG